MIDSAPQALTEQMQKAYGNALYWLNQVERGFRPHVDGVDNTTAFVEHYRNQLALASKFPGVHA